MDGWITASATSDSTDTDNLGGQWSTPLDFAEVVRTNCNNYQNSDNLAAVTNKKENQDNNCW